MPIQTDKLRAALVGALRRDADQGRHFWAFSGHAHAPRPVAPAMDAAQLKAHIRSRSLKFVEGPGSRVVRIAMRPDFPAMYDQTEPAERRRAIDNFNEGRGVFNCEEYVLAVLQQVGLIPRECVSALYQEMHSLRSQSANWLQLVRFGSMPTSPLLATHAGSVMATYSLAMGFAKSRPLDESAQPGDLLFLAQSAALPWCAHVGFYMGPSGTAADTALWAELAGPETTGREGYAQRHVKIKQRSNQNVSFLPLNQVCDSLRKFCPTASAGPERKSDITATLA